MIPDGFLNQIMEFFFEIFSLFQTIRKIHKGVCYRPIQHNIRTSDGIRGTYHTEFKFISGKSKRRCTVSVCGIYRKMR